MADTVRRAAYYYTEVPDQAGEGSRVFSALNEAGVNLLAFSGFPIGAGMTQLDFVPEDPDAFTKTAGDLDLDFSERKNVFLVQGDDRVGAAAETHRKLANEGINIVAGQAMAAGSGRFGMILWVKPEDYERAAGTLGA